MTFPERSRKLPTQSSEWRRFDQEEQPPADDARREELREWISWKHTHEMIKSELIGLYDEGDKVVKTLPMDHHCNTPALPSDLPN